MPLPPIVKNTTLIFYPLVIIFLFNSCSDNSPRKSNDNVIELKPYDGKVVALYSFNSTLKDRSKNHINLQGKNIHYGLDRNQNELSSLLLDNYNNYPSTKLNEYYKLDLSKEFTISMWVKPCLDSCLYDRGQYIDLIGRWGGTGENNSSYAVVLNSDGTIQGRTYNTEDGNTWVTTKSKLKDQKWNHIILTRNIQGVLSIYINSKLSVKDYIATPQSSNYELFIGKRMDDRSLFYGYIDDVIILNDYVQEEEIKKIMNINL